MDNLFKGKSDKQVPETLDDCIQPDGVSKNLWTWAARIESWGSVLLALIIIYGIIQAIYQGISTYGQMYYFSDDGAAVSSTILAVLSALFTYGIFAFLEYVAYHFIALLLGALASIVHNTNISANLSMYNAEGKGKDKFTRKSKQDPSVHSYEKISTAKSGRNAPASQYKVHLGSTPRSDNQTEKGSEDGAFIDIRCPHCGNIISYPMGTEIAVCPHCDATLELSAD